MFCARLLLLGSLPLSLGCQSSSSEPAADAGLDGAVIDAVDGGGGEVGPTAPALPASPQLASWSCPAGWEEHAVGVGTAAEHQLCQPPRRVECNSGELQPLGEERCAPIGTACPSEPFANASTIRGLAPGFDGPLVYVQSGATGGDGSFGKPYGKVSDALLLAAKGSIVALSRGTHAGPVVIDRRVALVGACTAETALEGPAGQAGDRTITIRAAGSRLANLRVSGERGGVLLLSVAGDPVTIDRVEIAGASNFGLMIALGSPELLLRRLVVRDVSGIGIAVGPDATIGGETIAIERASQLGLIVSDAEMVTRPSELALADVTIREVGAGGGPTDGQLVRFEGRGSVSIERCLLERGTDIALVVKGGGALELSDCVLRDTGVGALGEGRGLIVYDDGSAKLARTLVETQRVAALHSWTTDAGGTPKLALSDVVVRETMTGGSTQTAAALVVSGEVSGQRVLFEDNEDTAIFVASDQPDPAMSLQLTDVAVLGTRPRPSDGRRGVGLIADGGKVRLERALFANNHSHALLSGISRSDRTPPDLRLVDLTVRDTKPQQASGQYGRGLELQGSQVRIERALLQQNRDVALLLDRSSAPGAPAIVTDAEISDLVIRDTLSDPSAPFSGLALSLQRGGTLKVQRARLVANSGVGLLAIQAKNGAAASLTLLDVAIDDTDRSACAKLSQQSCEGGGIGLSLIGPVEADIQRFEIATSALCGLQVRQQATLDASQGAIHHNLIGVNVDEGSPLESILQPTVRLHDNEVAVDTTSLPIPDPVEAFQFGS